MVYCATHAPRFLARRGIVTLRLGSERVPVWEGYLLRVRETRISTAFTRSPTALLALLVGASLATPAGLAFGQTCPPLITDPTPLNTNAATDEGLDIGALVATDGAGTWVAVWRSTDTLGGKVGDDPDIFFARSFDEGQTWTDPRAITTNAGSDSGKDWLPRLATDDGSIWIVVWPSNDPLEGTIGHDFDILFARSTDGGAHSRWFFQGR